MLALRLLCFTLLAGCGANRMNHADVALHQQQYNASSNGLVEFESKDLTQLLTSAAGLITSIVSALAEDPPDYDHVFESLSLQGWKIVQIIVPKESQKSKGFRNAKKAFKEACEDTGELAADMRSAISDGETVDMLGLSHALLQMVDKALAVVSKALPEDDKYIRAIAHLFDGVGGSVLDFAQALGWLKSSSLMEIQGESKEKPSFSSMLTTGVGIITSCISAFSESPPDIEHAVDSINVQGWKMIKLMVPKEEQRSKAIRNAKKAWDKVMDEATDIIEGTLEAIESGYMGKIMRQLLEIIETALAAAKEVVAEDSKVFVEALSEFIGRFGHSILDFGKEMQWIA